MRALAVTIAVAAAIVWSFAIAWIAAAIARGVASASGPRPIIVILFFAVIRASGPRAMALLLTHAFIVIVGDCETERNIWRG
jgi:hypothetical protein